MGYHSFWPQRGSLESNKCCWICIVPLVWSSIHKNSSSPTPMVSHNPTSSSSVFSVSLNSRNGSPSTSPYGVHLGSWAALSSSCLSVMVCDHWAHSTVYAAPTILGHTWWISSRALLSDRCLGSRKEMLITQMQEQRVSLKWGKIVPVCCGHACAMLLSGQTQERASKGCCGHHRLHFLGHQHQSSSCRRSTSHPGGVWTLCHAPKEAQNAEEWFFDPSHFWIVSRPCPLRPCFLFPFLGREEVSPNLRISCEPCAYTPFAYQGPIGLCSGWSGTTSTGGWRWRACHIGSRRSWELWTPDECFSGADLCQETCGPCCVSCSRVPCTSKRAVHLTRMLAMQTYSPATDALIWLHGRLSAEEMTDGPHFKPLRLLPSMMKHLIPELNPSFLFFPPPARGKRILLIPASVLQADAT